VNKITKTKIILNFQSIPPAGIEIFGSQLHTHLTGTMIYTKHVRDGQELPELNRDNHYSTHFQEIRLLHKPVRVLPVSHDDHNMSIQLIYNIIIYDNTYA